MTKVYSNFIHVLRPGRGAGQRRGAFRVFSGMDLEYWQEFYLLGEAEPLAERIRGKIEALGGVEHVILNPLDWDVGTLERHRVRRPAAPARLTRPMGELPATGQPRRGARRRSRRPAADAARRRHRRVSGARRSADRRRHPRRHRPAGPARDRGRRRRLAGSRRSRPGPTSSGTDLPAAFDGLKAAARAIGGVQIQNRGTVCGNVCNASPAADGLPNLMALDARVELASSAGPARGAGRVHS